MKKFLCLKDYDDYAAGGLSSHGYMNDSFKLVETFKRDGMEWIKHDGGDCPVPGDWTVEAIQQAGCMSSVLSSRSVNAECWGWKPIVAYRIISTGEQERQFKSEEHREMVENANEFKQKFEDRGCSCHISPPCSCCTHPGNPLCLEAAGYDEDGNPLDSEQEEPLPIMSTYAEAIRSALEEAVSDGLLSPLPDIAESTHRVPGSVTGVDPSPVPAQPIDTTPQPKHTIPAQTVADIDYHPLRLGAAHFLKGEW